jgi:hypothetical protein
VITDRQMSSGASAASLEVSWMRSNFTVSAIYRTQCYSERTSTPKVSFAVYKNKPFARFARKAGIDDAVLFETARLADEGVIDADLGGGVIKQRIARPGQGKSGGSRAIILFRKGNRAVYIYGFEKKDLANIERRELEAFRELATVVLGYTETEMAKFIEAGVFFSVLPPKEPTYAQKNSQ